MIRKEAHYTDYNGEHQDDVLYFNLTKAEMGKMQMQMDGKFIDHLQLLLERKKIENVYDFFYNLVLNAYGEKTADGKHFHKTPAMRAEFENSLAFSEILMEIIADPDKLAAFVKGVLPGDMITEAGAVDVKTLPPTN